MNVSPATVSSTPTKSWQSAVYVASSIGTTSTGIRSSRAERAAGNRVLPASSDRLDPSSSHAANREGQPVVGRGLRVLLVYPMNALVNDQIRRLRQLVGYRSDRGEAPIPITFARYTSETRDHPEIARQREPDAPSNQILTRTEIIRNPPDILITNFAMLEQALLRPQESPFFDDVDDFAWRFLYPRRGPQLPWSTGDRARETDAAGPCGRPPWKAK